MSQHHVRSENTGATHAMTSKMLCLRAMGFHREGCGEPSDKLTFNVSHELVAKLVINMNWPRSEQHMHGIVMFSSMFKNILNSRRKRFMHASKIHLHQNIKGIEIVL